MKKFLSAIVGLFTKLAGLFTSDAAKRDLDLIASYTLAAFPYVRFAADLITGITPTTLDDAALAWTKQNYPHLFDGSLTDAEALKKEALWIASDLLKRAFPALSKSAAVGAVQMAFISTK